MYVQYMVLLFRFLTDFKIPSDDIVNLYYFSCKLNNIFAAVSQHEDATMRKEEWSKRKEKCSDGRSLEWD